MTSPDAAPGKGRPTPKRKDAQKANQRPVVAAAAAAGGKRTREEKRAARAAAREARQITRLGHLNGDERYLAARDSGPVRRWARDYIDARRNLGEMLMFAGLGLATIAIIGGLLKQPAITTVMTLMLYPLIFATAIDAFLLRRRVQKLADEKFGAAKTAGVGTYAMMRSLQIRRLRVPLPAVKRGETPRG